MEHSDYYYIEKCYQTSSAVDQVSPVLCAAILSILIITFFIGSFNGVVANVPDCDIIISELELLL